MRNVLFVFLALALSACGTVKVSADGADPGGKIAATQEYGVDDNPDARLHLQLAKENLAAAEAFRAEEEEDEAALALIKADADAELALALVRRDAAQAEVREVQAKIDKLKAEMEGTQ